MGIIVVIIYAIFFFLIRKELVELLDGLSAFFDNSKKEKKPTDRELVVKKLVSCKYMYNVLDDRVTFEVDSPEFNNKFDVSFDAILDDATFDGVLKVVKEHQLKFI